MAEETKQSALSDAARTSTIRLWAATIITIILVIAVWKFIDFRMQPPPPPNSPEMPAAAP